MIHPFISLVRVIQKNSVRSQMKGQSFPNGVDVINDIYYKNDESIFHTLDIYYPSGNDKTLPTLLSVHGGAFVGGDKFYNKELCMRLALAGFVVVNVNYDLAPDTTLTGMVKCLNDAILWVHKNISFYNGSSDEIYALGDSAGGWQILTYSIVNNNDELRKIYKFEAKNPVIFRSLVLICPVANVKRAMDKHSKIKTFGTAVYRWKMKGADYELTSIQDLIKYGNIPNSIIITTPNDHYFYQSQELKKLFDENNVSYQYHSFETNENIIDHCFNIMHPQYVESIHANNEIIAFLKR